MQANEPWRLTILLLEGLRFMRPEKVWRPIVTIEVDRHHSHETTLGIDGQNTNQKEVFRFQDGTPSSRLEAKVWHLSQSKKKRRRVLVASANLCLGELLRKRDLDSRSEIKLQCRSAVRPSQASRGRPQKGATLHISLRQPRVEQQLETEEEIVRVFSADDESFGSVSEDSESIATIDSGLNIPRVASRLGLRRRLKGYSINTDDEIFSSDGECIFNITKDRFEDNSQTCVGDEEPPNPELHYDDHRMIIHPYPKDTISRSEELAASDIPLPLYTEKIRVPSDFSRSQNLVASCTIYREISQAQTDDHFELLFRRLQQEWSQNGALLCALAAIDTAVFTLAPNSMFFVTDYAKNAIALSSVASGVGLACDAWFLLRYSWIDVQTFSTRARDVYDSYLFFSISARVPTICTCLSAISLTGFLGLVAFGTWPEAVLLFCFVVGILMSLQYLVYGVHIAARTVANGGRAGRDRIMRVFVRSSEQ